MNWRNLTFLVDRYFTGMNYGPHLGKVLVARLALLFIRNNHIQIKITAIDAYGLLPELPFFSSISEPSWDRTQPKGRIVCI